MKKIFGLFLIAGMLVVSACGTGAKQDATTTTDSIAATAIDTTAVADTTTAPVK